VRGRKERRAIGIQRYEPVVTTLRLSSRALFPILQALTFMPTCSGRRKN
jgi:hypothetical protein